MTYAAATDLAMVLPIPVPSNSPEDAVRFINLNRYPAFFDDMGRGFLPAAASYSPDDFATTTRSLAKLRVHDVGSFEASFVPCIKDFARLDDRFRIPGEVWDRLPEYNSCNRSPQEI